MKRPLLCLTAVLCFLFTHAQQIKHPALLYTPQRIEQAKQRISSDRQMSDAWNSIQKTADNLLKKTQLEKIDYLALSFLMTNDEKYSDKIKEILLDAIKDDSWGNEEMMARTPAWNADLNMAHKAFYAAIAYDAVYNKLSPSERKRIAQGLKRLAMEPLLGDWIMEPTRIHSLNSMGHNWWTSCVCMGGILALSLQNELQEAKDGAAAVNEVLPEWFDFTGDVLQQKPKTFDDAGGMYECLNYANYGIQEALLFRLAWMNTHKGEKTTDIPHLKKLSAFFAHICYPRTGILYNINFGDSHKNTAAESSLMLLYAMGIQDKDILWYMSQVKQGQHRDGYFIDRPMGFLYTPDLSKAPPVPDLKKSQLFEDFGWATMRNSWEKDATMLAVKSGHTWNHSHADANSFILFHKGEDIIKDGGRCWYPNPEYRNYFFQSEAHNVVLFNGKGQRREQQYHGSALRGYMHYLLDSDNMKYVLADGTGPYSDQFSRNFRHFLWIDNVIYIIDDLKTHETGHFEWLWHPGGVAQKRGTDLNITNGNSAVVVRPLYPRMLAASNFVHDYPDDLYWQEIEAPTEDLKGKESYYSFHLPAEVNRVKGVTAIILKESPDDKNLPRIEKREGKDWIGLRIRNKGKITDIYINQLADGRLMHSNSWIEADGWSTDAYMFAVTYPDNNTPVEANEYFICYGSSLRRGATSYFSSLTKLFMIQKEENKHTRLFIEGSPKVRAIVRSPYRPVAVSVNGKEIPVVHDRSMLKIKL